MPHVARDLYQKCREYRDSADARAQGFYPYFRCIEETHGNYVICEGQRKIMIGSNNYLGLAQDERVIEAACEATRKYGSGCTGSRLLNGTLKLHTQLEEALAEFLAAGVGAAFFHRIFRQSRRLGRAHRRRRCDSLRSRKSRQHH